MTQPPKKRQIIRAVRDDRIVLNVMYRKTFSDDISV
jgi:hypothetical protein